MNDVEIQYDGSVEKSYSISHPEGIRLKMNLLSLYPEAGDFRGVEMISFHEKDGVSYLDDCIVCVYKSYPSVEVLKRFGGDTEGDYQDYYTIKYPLNKTINPYLKVYSNEFQFYRVPSLPRGACMNINLTGIGLHYGAEKLVNVRDFYFSHDDRELMMDYYGSLYPHLEEDFEVNTRSYAIIYDEKTLEVLKVKRYVFSYDPGFFHLRGK